MQTAPIIIMAYNRPLHLEKVINSLKKDPLFAQTNTTVFLDGLKSQADFDNRQKCKNLIEKEIRHKKEGQTSLINLVDHPENLGIAKSVSYALKYTLEKYDNFIYLEDDTLPQEGFLNWMNQALLKTKADPNIYAVTGYSFPFVSNLTKEDCYLSYRFSPWGFASWKHKINLNWKLTLNTKLKLLNFFYWKKLNRFSYGWGYTLLAEAFIPFLAKKTQSWDILLFYRHFQKKQLCLSPTISYIYNIGLDGSGQHVPLDYLQELSEESTRFFSLKSSVFNCDPSLSHDFILKISQKLTPLYRKKSLRSFINLIFKRN